VANYLTGNIRYRNQRRLFGSDMLVLQVEIKRDDGPPDYHGMPEYLGDLIWRDAIVEDLLELGAIQRMNGE
jgi:hypothetical protein